MMTSRPGISTQIWERSTLLTLVGMVIVLIVVTVVIVGTGLQSGFVWIILAGICIVWAFVCSCSKCKKITNQRLRRTSDRSDTISTISDFNDNGYPHPVPIDDAWDWAQDLPPSYDIVSNTLEQQPPSYASVIALNPAINRQRTDIPGSPAFSLPPPPPYIDTLSYNYVTVNTITNRYTAGILTSNSEIITVHITRPSDEPVPSVLPSREHTCTSIISGCNLNENEAKITNNNMPVIDSPELTSLPNDNHNVLPHPTDLHLHTVLSEQPGRDHSSTC